MILPLSTHTQADLQPSDHVLEIGCGWGGFAIRAAQTIGCRVTGLTISKEQLSEATARVRALGLEDKVTLLFCDYRLCPGECPEGSSSHCLKG